MRLIGLIEGVTRDEFLVQARGYDKECSAEKVQFAGMTA